MAYSPLQLKKEKEQSQSDLESTSDHDAMLDKFKRQNLMNKQILQNQIQIGKSLQKDIERKQNLIKSDLKFKMGLMIIKGLLKKKKRVLEKRFFKLWLSNV